MILTTDCHSKIPAFGATIPNRSLNQATTVDWVLANMNKCELSRAQSRSKDAVIGLKRVRGKYLCCGKTRHKTHKIYIFHFRYESKQVWKTKRKKLSQQQNFQIRTYMMSWARQSRSKDADMCSKKLLACIFLKALDVETRAQITVRPYKLLSWQHE